MTLTPDARQARSTRAGSRADRFLKGSGALVVAFSASRPRRPASTGGPARRSPRHRQPISSTRGSPSAPTARVTAYTGKCEFGQGLYTAQTQLVAEELGVPLIACTLIQCDTALTPDQGTTSGAQSHPTNFNQANLALAGATAREALVQLAADAARRARRSARGGGRRRQRAGRSARSVSLRRADRRQEVRHRARTRTRSASTRASGPCSARRCRASTCRRWSPAEFEFVHNVRVPGMLHGRVVRPPAVGATLVQRRRKLGRAHARRRQGRRQEELRRRRRREAVAGDAGRRQAEGDVDARHRACRASATSTSTCGQQPTRDTLLVDSGDVDASARAAPPRS